MNEREIMEQLESLIETWQLDEADLNQTDINAIKQMLDKNKKLKERLEKERNARIEASEFIKNNQRKDEFVELNEWQARDLISILDIDKGE